jgi:hypothetical protein
VRPGDADNVIMARKGLGSRNQFKFPASLLPKWEAHIVLDLSYCVIVLSTSYSVSNRQFGISQFWHHLHLQKRGTELTCSDRNPTAKEEVSPKKCSASHWQTLSVRLSESQALPRGLAPFSLPNSPGLCGLLSGG